MQLLGDHVLGDDRVGLDSAGAPPAREGDRGAGQCPADAALAEARAGEQARHYVEVTVLGTDDPPDLAKHTLHTGEHEKGKQMGWRHDEKKARKLAESDPAGAVALMESVVPQARESSLCGAEHLCDLLAFESEIAEQAGRSEVAARSRAELTALAEQGIAEQDERLTHQQGVMGTGGALQIKARYLDRLGRDAEASRIRLHAADILLAGAGDAGAKASMASSPLFVMTQGAMGFESAAQFRRSFEKTYVAQAEALRDPLLADGRAVAVAYCKRCGSVVEADYKKHRCLHKHKVDDVRVVPAEDAESVRRDLGRGTDAST